MAQEKEKLTEQDQQEVIFERHYERHMPRGLGFSAGYAMFNEFDFSVFSICCAYPIRITGWRRIHLGWDPLHLRIDDIGVSDDALLPMGGFFLFYGIETIVRNIKGTIGPWTEPGTLVLAPLFIWCGMVYIPLVPSSWLGINDQNHFTTHVIQEGFHTRSFIYTNDLSLRFSARPSSSGFFLDTGIRFEKNFAEDFKYRLFVQLGIWGSG